MQGTLITKKNWVNHINWMNRKKSETVVRRCSIKKSVLKNFAKSTGKPLKPVTLLKQRIKCRCFPVNLAKFLRTPFFIKCGGCFCKI